METTLRFGTAFLLLAFWFSSEASAAAVDQQALDVNRRDFNALVRAYAAANVGTVTLVDYDMILDADRDTIMDDAVDAAGDRLHPDETGFQLLQNAFHAAITSVIAADEAANG